MKIKRLQATFGTLKNAELRLQEGLNIVEAPNESGKSTWSAFIKAMLYGVSTSDRDKIGYLSDKTRYKPWDGSAMEGTMELEQDGKSITLQRTSQGQAPMRKVLAVYTGTLDKVEPLLNGVPGEVLTGVSEPVFVRTAFIRQAGIRIQNAADLEKCVSSVVSGSEEQTSAQEAGKLLETWQRKLRFNKAGSLPKLEAQLTEAEETMRRLEQMGDQLAEMRAGLEKLEKDRRQLEEDLKVHEKLEERAVKMRILEAGNRAKNAKEDLESIRADLTKSGRPVTREDISEMRGAIAALGSLAESIQNADTAKEKAQQHLEHIQAQKANTSFAGLTREEAVGKAAEARAMEAAAQQEKRKRKPLWLKILLCVLAALGAAAAVCAGGLVWHVLPAAIAGGAVSIAALATLLYAPKDETDKNAFAHFLRNCGFADMAAYCAAAEEYASLCDREEQAKIDLAAARQGVDAAHKTADDAKNTVLVMIGTFMPEIKELREVPTAVSHLEDLLERQTKAEFNMVSAQNIYATLTSGYDGDLENIDYSYLPPPLRTREDTEAALARVQEKLREKTGLYDLARGELRAMGDPAVLSGEIQAIKEEIALETQKYETLALTIQVFQEASAEMQTRVSPIISKLAGGLVQRLTDGKYQKLVFDKSFNASAKTEADPVSRDVLSLSTGTSDQIYLALRLAMCELVLTGEDPCPILLDDALANFDAGRMSRALDLLREMGKERQIILFTCHDREAAYCKDFPDVHRIRL